MQTNDTPTHTKYRQDGGGGVRHRPRAAPHDARRLHLPYQGPPSLSYHIYIYHHDDGWTDLPLTLTLLLLPTSTTIMLSDSSLLLRLVGAVQPEIPGFQGQIETWLPALSGLELMGRDRVDGSMNGATTGWTDRPPTDALTHKSTNRHTRTPTHTTGEVRRAQRRARDGGRERQPRGLLPHHDDGDLALHALPRRGLDPGH